MNHMLIKQPMLFIFSILLIICGLACNDRGADPITFSTYRVAGIMVADPNIDSIQAAIDIDKDGTVLTGAGVWLNSDSLPFNAAGFKYDSVYSLVEDSLDYYLPDTVALRIEDPTELDDTLTFVVPDTFFITGVVPTNHLIVGNGTATVDWFGSSRSDAYIVVAVKADNAYTGLGYAQYAQTGMTASTIPPDAFLQPGTDVADTGLYNLYVYAISGAPDSVMSAGLLPVPLPDQLADNIAGESIDGTFGTIVITRLDTIRVATIQ